MKALIDFMQKHYTDERLAMLLAHAEDGKLAFNSCCCFIGIPTAEHALAGDDERREPNIMHHHVARKWAGGKEAEYAYAGFGLSDAERRTKLIPLIKAEMERRENLRSLTNGMDEVHGLGTRSEQTNSVEA